MDEQIARYNEGYADGYIVGFETGSSHKLNQHIALPDEVREFLSSLLSGQVSKSTIQRKSNELLGRYPAATKNDSAGQETQSKAISDKNNGHINKEECAGRRLAQEFKDLFAALPVEECCICQDNDVPFICTEHAIAMRNAGWSPRSDI